MIDEHDRYEDDLAAYALGALNELETRAFERHLMRCSECARELERTRPVVDALPAAAPQHRAPAGLKDAVMARVRAEADTVPESPPPVSARRRPLLRRRPALALAGGLAAVALALGAFGLGGTLSDAEREVVAAAVDRTQLPRASAELARRGDLGVLRAQRLPQAPRGEVYVVWVDRGDGPAYASSFNAGPDGAAEAGIDALEGVERVMVTREASTTVAHPSESPVVTVELD